MRDENKFLGWRSRAGTHWRVAEECPGPGGERGPESVARPGRGPPWSCPAVPSSLHAGPVALGWGSAGCPQRNDKAGHSDAWQGPQAGRRGGKQEAGREKRALAGGPGSRRDGRQVVRAPGGAMRSAVSGGGARQRPLRAVLHCLSRVALFALFLRRNPSSGSLFPEPSCASPPNHMMVQRTRNEHGGSTRHMPGSPLG